MRKSQRLGFGVATLILLLTVALSALAAESEPTETQLFLRGAKLWGAYCGQCHNARSGSEFNRLEWDTLLLHMRVRANLPAADAEALRVFLRSSH
ncbi:MAG: cytochrome c [Deltaproteobacteria bacterium]|nr:cytochrome c [Deltaproteobacteria bacterium]